jgi:hypothetical protein
MIRAIKSDFDPVCIFYGFKILAAFTATDFPVFVRLLMGIE